jgi:hypothetical protein
LLIILNAAKTEFLAERFLVYESTSITPTRWICAEPFKILKIMITLIFRLKDVKAVSNLCLLSAPEYNYTQYLLERATEVSVPGLPGVQYGGGGSWRIAVEGLHSP